MKSWIWGSVSLILVMLGSLAAGVVYHEIDWLNAIAIFFTLYGAALLFVPLFGRPRRFLTNDCYRPFVTILIPARNEEDVIESTVRSMCALQYRKNGRPNFEVVVMDDASTDETPGIVSRLGQELPMVRLVRRFPPESGNGKSAVLNDGLRHSSGEIVAVFDADTRVEPDFLLKTVAHLYDPQVGGVQARVRIYNANQNVLTAMQEDEFSVLAHLWQMAKDAVRGVTALGGNGQLTRRSAIEAAGGWNELSTTEDLDLTFRLLLEGFSVRYCGDAVLWQEAVPTASALLRQRVRWCEGFIKCVFDYTLPLVFRGKIGLWKRWDGILSLLRVLLPLWILIVYVSVGAGIAMGGIYHGSIPGWAFEMTSGAFFLVTFLAIHRIQQVSVWGALIGVARYWAYNFIWMLAVPMGFVNCLKNLNRIQWDKTIHCGEAVRVSRASLPRPYRPAASASLAEVIE